MNVVGSLVIKDIQLEDVMDILLTNNYIVEVSNCDDANKKKIIIKETR